MQQHLHQPQQFHAAPMMTNVSDVYVDTHHHHLSFISSSSSSSSSSWIVVDKRWSDSCSNNKPPLPHLRRQAHNTQQHLTNNLNNLNNLNNSNNNDRYPPRKLLLR
jgi:hypothetical protein